MFLKKTREIQLDHSFCRLPPHFYRQFSSAPLTSSGLLDFNDDVARLLDLDPDERYNTPSPM